MTRNLHISVAAGNGCVHKVDLEIINVVFLDDRFSVVDVQVGSMESATFPGSSGKIGVDFYEPIIHPFW